MTVGREREREKEWINYKIKLHHRQFPNKITIFLTSSSYHLFNVRPEENSRNWSVQDIQADYVTVSFQVVKEAARVTTVLFTNRSRLHTILHLSILRLDAQNKNWKWHSRSVTRFVRFPKDNPDFPNSQIFWSFVYHDRNEWQLDNK